ncbi:uncharacterized protein YjbI with pentapeptide repeats [Stackebrandtia endophytica]|uniref:Uncharacterized protein YjbI with pentapeptide repeats n=1 Tax=Stackebrandtia endophytica TaxID=1496996 RepID=A0A543APW1_9ACTN|nr:pentapeptide repeat-containing protein [Stackebrandtia endophytica]TQL74620.1 uncharacterized protein YjbI with pentapeptide repeats [Stackebrandtia endophytica]
MAKPRSGPASPQMPARLTPAEDVDHPLEEESDWWQLEFTGGDHCGAEAVNFQVEQCRFDRTDFSAGVWRSGTFRDCRFGSVNLAGVVAERSSLFRSSVEHARATGLQWTDGVLKDVTFTECRLDLAGFRFSRLDHVVFDNCRMSGVDLTNCDLSKARFVNCDLTGAKLHHAKAVGARFEHCVLDDVSGVEALAGAVIEATDLIPLTFMLARALGVTIRLPDE